MRKHRHLPIVAIISIILSGCCMVEAQQQEDVKIVAAADIIFLVDSSWSIGKEHFQLVREFLYDVVKSLDVGENDFHFALVQFSGNPHTEFQLNTYRSTQDVLSHILNMPYMGGGTKTGKGLEYLIQNHLSKAAGSRASDGTPQIIIVLTDGRSQDDVALPSSVLKSADVNMFAIGVQNAVEGELKEIASEPLDLHVFNLENFTALHNIVGDLVASVRTSMTPEMAGEKGVVKDITAQDSADLIFLIDGSNNIGSVNFQAIRDFLVNLIENLRVGAQQIHTGVVQYSDEPRTEFFLNSYSTKADVLDAVKALSFLGGEEANTGAALEYVVQNHFTRAGGSRIEEAVPQILVLISGGESSDDVREGVLAVKQASIFSLSIGVLNADSAELQQIATDGSFAFSALDVRNLDGLQEQLLPNIVGVAQRLILLEAPTIVTEVIEVNKKDIVFLIDGTTAMGSTHFSAIRDFIAKIVQRLEIGPDLIQVAVAQYADTVKPEFYFNDHQSRKDVHSAVRKIKLMGGSTLNTGLALDFVRNNFFVSSTGCRIDEGVLPMLVLVTSGKSRDDITQPVAEMKRSRIMVLTIGSKNADKSELQVIAHEPELVFSADDFRVQPLQALLPRVLTPLKTLSGAVIIQEIPSVQVNKRDIIFLLDGSLNVGNANFPFVRDFVLKLVDYLDVGIDNIRIGLIQFSDTPRTEFFLNTYLIKSEIINRLGQLKPKGGSVLNTGSALDFVLANHFTEAGGSRIDEQVEQILVLVTAGQSADAYLDASHALARAGVLTFCVGVRNANKAELEQIAFDPRMVYFTDDFSSLAALPQELIKPLTTYVSGGVQEVPLTPSESKKDILFMIDGSANLLGQFPAVRDFVHRIISDLNVSPDAIRVAVVQFSDNVQVEFNFSELPSKQDMLLKVKRMKIKTGKQLNIGSALDYAVRNLFVKNAGSRIEEGVPQFLVLLAAGKSSDSVEDAAEALKRAGVVTFIIKARTAEQVELERIVYDPQFILSVDSLSRIGEIQSNIVNLLKTIQYQPTVVGDEKKDVVFLIDGSDGARSGFSFLKNFVLRMVESLDISRDRVHVAVAQYSNVIRPEFLFNSYYDKADVIRAIQGMSVMGGSPLNTGAALDYLIKQIFTAQGGSRIAENVPQFLILLTADRSRDDVRRPSVVLKTSGAVPFGIGIGNADITEMQTISFVPDFAAVVPDFNQLDTVQQLISDRVTRLTKKEIETLAPDLLFPSPSPVKKDVVFLIDGSQFASSEFQLIRDFIVRVVDSLDVGFDTTRVAVVQFSTDPKVEFLLNTHSTKDDVQSAVRRLRPKGGREVNVGDALEYVAKNIFTRPSGSRIEDGVPQFLILLSSRKSNDEVVAPAVQIKQVGVAPLVIAKNVDPEELAQISLSPEYVYQVTNFQELPSIEQKLLSPLTSLTADDIKGILGDVSLPPDGEGDERDIVFLIDSSDSVRTDGLAHIRDFIIKIVQQLNVGPNKVRIGVVQFSNDVFPEFYLKTHKTKTAVVDAIRRLRFRGGSPLNAGKALDYVVKNYFIKSAGSRIEDTVPQHLVLFLGERSQDDVNRPSSVITSVGITSQGVGARNADRTQLERITNDPRLVFTVRDFPDLPSIESRFLQPILRPQIYTTEPPIFIDMNGKKQADIVFLLDGSINLGRENFQEVIQFVSSIVDAIYDDTASIQVGLAQYNSDVTDEFFLKDHTTKQEILDAINKVAYKGGRVANTGAAIKHLQAKHFVKEAGSRADQRIPQIAFIVTGGRPADDGQTAALALKQSGVKLFAVGVKNIDLDEVNKLSSEPATGFRVKAVQELSELNEQILVTMDAVMKETLCPGVTDVSRDCKLDVILGFDVSDTGPGQNIFYSQRGLESKVEAILNRITQMQRISCTGNQQPTIRVAIMGQSTTGAIEGLDFIEYQPELFEKFQAMRNRGPYYLTADTLKSYQNKFRTAPSDSVKVVIHLTDGADDGMARLAAASTALQKEGVKALIFVGLERVQNLEDLMQIEFGRGFTYNRPLRVNLLDLDYELAEQLDNIAERYCCGVSCKCSGQRGDRGVLGPIGPKGVPGENGYRGYPGDEGGPGDRGPPGVNGTQGFQGCPGQRGIKGSRGFPGEKGEVGEMGLDGIDGEDGNKGLPGFSGEKGNPGQRGYKGPKGEKGERGDRGLRGDPGENGVDNTQRGPRGSKGEIGPMGDDGVEGALGSAGGRGKNGNVGRRGPPGPKGPKGTPGQAGQPGEQGRRGAQGPPGQLGTPGIRGEQGIPGPRGSGGPAGPPGERGRTGPFGLKGEPGDSGPPGPSGYPGTRGETGEDGLSVTGDPGPKGRKGERGFPGPPGPKGASGDRGGSGSLGVKGNRGRRGNAGEPGDPGQPGDYGYAGPPGLRGDRGEARDECALVRNIKDKCPCCYGPKECPVYPTELAFAIDTSQGVNRDVFNRMKQAVLRVVNSLTIAESNCPRGARVALVTYNNEVTTEIRFADSRKKSSLIQQLQNLQPIQTTKQRSLETAMAFVARNTFKRARSGFLMKKVAVFFSNGPTRATAQLNDAVLKLYDAGVWPVFLTNRDDSVLINALKINNTAVGHATVLPTGGDQLNRTIQRLLRCHICLDTCDPDADCEPVVQRTSVRDKRAASTDVDTDMAFIIDSSESTTPLQFSEIKKYISHIVRYMVISSDPKASQHHARVAVLQHAPYEYETNTSSSPVKVALSLTDYGSKDKITNFIQNQMTQLHGTRALGSAIEYTIAQVFESSPNPRDLKVIVLMMTGKVNKEELDYLQRVVIHAKCKGYFFVVMGIGKRVNVKNIYSLASEPNDVFFKLVDKPSELQEDSLLRFGRLLPSFISSENAFYLSPDVRKQCDWFQGDQPAKNPTKFGQKTMYFATNVTKNTRVDTSTGTSARTKTRSGNTMAVTSASTTAHTTAGTTLGTKTSITATTTTTTITTTTTTTASGTARPQKKAAVKMANEIQITDITETSAKLRWGNPEPESSYVFDITVTSAHDHSLVLKQNVTSTEQVIGGLRSGQKYHVVIIGYQKSQIKLNYMATFSTKSPPQSKAASIATANLMVNTEPLEVPETVTDICRLQKEEGTCRKFELKWYYDSNTKSCARFWYGGCGGNENKFSTQKECEKVCIPGHINPGVVTMIGT
ncbi:collagen alpha-3(VI) chain isoform X4 [Alligator mississippiensis]|uniref:collagen alpha-3(VI) chain isoform X4 n=1 Tax=Alligator mississippiensis TaxID=8496 RepID=UPI0007122654|nr:collagen alpha-3(VI) chain isoform X4 [Alligator mississippiensis]